MPEHKKLKRNVTCRCEAYPFPHRLLSGKCDQYTVIAKVWKFHNFCIGCYWRDVNQGAHDEPPSARCRILDELLDADLCPGIGEVVDDVK